MARKIGHGPAHVFERGANAMLEVARRRGVARPVDLHHLPGLELRVAAVDADHPERAARIAAHGQHRMHDEVHGDVHLAEDDADRIHEEGHVRRDHAQQRAMRGGGRVDVERRRDVDAHFVSRAPASELQVSEGRGRQVRGTMGAQIFFGDTAEERAQELPGQRMPRARQASSRRA